jgi:hypothetical protein
MLSCDWVRYYLNFPDKGLKQYYDNEKQLEGAFYTYNSRGENVQAIRKDFMFNLETILMQTN